jgi:hypothetical protein
LKSLQLVVAEEEDKLTLVEEAQVLFNMVRLNL